MAKNPKGPTVGTSQTSKPIMRPSPPVKNDFKGFSGTPSIPESRPSSMRNLSPRKGFNPGKNG